MKGRTENNLLKHLTSLRNLFSGHSYLYGHCSWRDILEDKSHRFNVNKCKFYKTFSIILQFNKEKIAHYSKISCKKINVSENANIVKNSLIFVAYFCCVQFDKPQNIDFKWLQCLLLLYRHGKQIIKAKEWTVLMAVGGHRGHIPITIGHKQSFWSSTSEWGCVFPSDNLCIPWSVTNMVAFVPFSRVPLNTQSLCWIYL